MTKDNAERMDHWDGKSQKVKARFPLAPFGGKVPFLSFGAIIQHQRLYYGGLWKAKPWNPLQTTWRDRVWEIVNNCVLIAITLISGLWGSGHHAKHFAWITSFSLHNSMYMLKYVRLFDLVFRWGNWGSERPSHLSQVTLMSAWVGLSIRSAPVHSLSTSPLCMLLFESQWLFFLKNHLYLSVNDLGVVGSVLDPLQGPRS